MRRERPLVRSVALATRGSESDVSAALPVHVPAKRVHWSSARMLSDLVPVFEYFTRQETADGALELCHGTPKSHAHTLGARRRILKSNTECQPRENLHGRRGETRRERGRRVQGRVCLVPRKSMTEWPDMPSSSPEGRPCRDF
jgi:hypothetical protein